MYCFVCIWLQNAVIKVNSQLVEQQRKFARWLTMTSAEQSWLRCVTAHIGYRMLCMTAHIGYVMCDHSHWVRYVTTHIGYVVCDQSHWVRYVWPLTLGTLCVTLGWKTAMTTLLHLIHNRRDHGTLVQQPHAPQRIRTSTSVSTTQSFKQHSSSRGLPQSREWFAKGMLWKSFRVDKNKLTILPAVLMYVCYLH